ncbi:MAG: group III truncated hemoglobin [Flavobacteriaceae bacterium]
MNDIRNREDVALLVNTFYTKVRANDELGPIFNSAISDWDSHLIHLTNFWESQLFRKNVFSGNPLKKHVEVDQANNNSLTNDLFGLWLQFWLGTIDELFEGELADLAKHRARNIASFMFMEIFRSRQNQ